jgi:hypothetical protein
MSEANKPSSAQWPVAQILREVPFVEQIFVPEQGDHSVEWPSGKQRTSPEQLSRLISKTAYSIAQRRNFHAGYEIEDWLGAEAEVMARMREIEQAARVGPPAG